MTTRNEFIKIMKEPAHDGFVIDDEVLEMALELFDKGLVKETPNEENSQRGGRG